MVDRMLTSGCLRCGIELIVDFMGNYNKYHCCSACSEWIEKSRYEASKPVKKNKKKKTFHPTQGQVIFINDIYKEAE